MTKRALLIGINEYQLPGADLRGCVNDVHNMAAVLEELYDFTPAEVTMLLDGAATKSAIEQGITRLVDTAGPGDVLYLHYSGHGSYVKDASGDEPDERDEIICPTDLDWDDPLTDDWLRTTFARLHPEATLTVVMDCCHSGTNTRAPLRPGEVPDVLPRFLPNPFDLGRGSRVDARGRGRRGRRRRAVEDVHEVDIIETLVTGCRDRQTSADADIGGSFNGALSYYLAEAMREDPSSTYRELHERTVKALHGRYEQVPQLEGRAVRLDRAVLSS